MPKIDGCGKAEILSEFEQAKIRKVLSGWHQIFWDIACYTGERWGAICALQVEDVYENSFKREPREYVTFRAGTTKTRQTRQVPVHPILGERLRAYTPPLSEWLFPSNEGHVTRQAADAFLRVALEKCGYEGKGISTHSTRRTFITRLHQRGISVKTIQEITGHKSLQVLSGYIQVTPLQVRQAIACL